MKKQTRTYYATSSTGKVVTIRDSRDFFYGIFITFPKNCHECAHCCKKGETVFQGCTKTLKAAHSKTIKFCTSMPIVREIVELEFDL